jgi:hypothetical protein
LRVSDHCTLTSFEGTFSGKAHLTSADQDTTTDFHGTLRLDPASSTEWKIGPSSLTLDSMSGTVGGCAASLDSTSFGMPTPAQDAPVMRLADGRYTLGAGVPEDLQVMVHLTGDGCADATLPLSQFVRDIAGGGTQAPPAPDGTVAGSVTLTPADGVAEDLAWSLAPVPAGG